MTAARILVVEDEAIVALQVRSTLEQRGYVVEDTCASGDEALACIAASPPDLVLMDMQLQGPMDGVATAAAIHATGDIPVVYLTAHSEAVAVARANTTQPYGYLLKPFNPLELCITVDVALHKHRLDMEKAQLAAHVSAQAHELRAYFESPSIGVAIVDEDDRWSRVNGSLCGMLGYSAEALAGMTWLELTHPEDRGLHEAALPQLLAGDRETMALDKRYLRKDGTVLWALTSVNCIRGADGRVVKRVAIINDITERKVAEAQVRTALEENERLVGELREALQRVTTLSGLLPICMHCKKIRDDSGYWERIEQYISSHTGVLFSHGLCPECLETHYKASTDP